MPASIVSVEIHLPGARSLKDKRRIVKSLKDRIHHRFRVSISEVDRHDARQSAVLGIATVAPSHDHLGEIVASIRGIFDQRPEVIVSHWHEELHEVGR